jgi:serine protease inhibitor
MGMTNAFDKDVAEFFKMKMPSGENLYVQSVLHKAMVDVGEAA